MIFCSLNRIGLCVDFFGTNPAIVFSELPRPVVQWLSFILENLYPVFLRLFLLLLSFFSFLWEVSINISSSLLTCFLSMISLLMSPHQRHFSFLLQHFLSLALTFGFLRVSISACISHLFLHVAHFSHLGPLAY